MRQSIGLRTIYFYTQNNTHSYPLPPFSPCIIYLRSSIHSGAEALPVKLEALQVLTQLIKGYFPTIRHILDHICDIIIRCLQDQDPSIQLHALKVG